MGVRVSWGEETAAGSVVNASCINRPGTHARACKTEAGAEPLLRPKRKSMPARCAHHVEGVDDHGALHRLLGRPGCVKDPPPARRRRRRPRRGEALAGLLRGLLPLRRRQQGLPQQRPRCGP